MLASKGIAIFIIPIVFSFVYGGAVLGSALQGQDRTAHSSIEILHLEGQYSSTDKITIQVSTQTPKFDCGDLYITIYDISGAKTAVKQGAFFDQCYGDSGMLPLNEKFSEKLDPGKYILEAQLFDKTGDSFQTTSQQFTVQ